MGDRKAKKGDLGIAFIVWSSLSGGIARLAQGSSLTVRVHICDEKYAPGAGCEHVPRRSTQLPSRACLLNHEYEAKALKTESQNKARNIWN